ncbi:hypothetical protein SAMN05216593_1058 [Pseudomonas asturiensis]|uniref:Uncharacterized protein n=1 Tax=Pseudomonas asturiensis TaxID=1190415 RepID=A0A1M7MYD8_9PSED|nr:hypothetical protein [Pseudomonas asturiensis]SHM96242.1 hypothetical protein SAMN05216593_1058 [Pseudomonas asturiensis]
MSNFSVYLIFMVTTTLFYFPAFWARYALSGHHFSAPKLWGFIIYNVACGHVHFKFASLGTLPFLGTVDNSVLGWISLFMVIAHALSLPSPKERKRFFYKPARLKFKLWKHH